MKTIKYLLLLLICNVSNAQINLVPNPGFEIDTSCGAGIITVAVPWDAPTNGTPDLYNSCSGGQVGVPSNNFGFQYAHTGNGYAGGGFYNSGSVVTADWEYMQVELDTDLVANKTYCASFYVSLANRSKFAIKNIGMYFSNSHTFQSTLANLNFIPQIIHTSFVTDTMNWVQVKGSFTAIGGERYIIIGNFDSPSSTDTISIKPNGSFAYYYIDDVDVHLLNPAFEVCCCDTASGGQGIAEYNKQQDYFNLYPNPANGKLNVEIKGYKGKASKVKIYNILGEMVKGVLKMEDEKLTIDIDDLPNGLYFIEVKTEAGIMRKKLVKE